MRPVVYPGDFLSRETPPAIELFNHRFLAEGDSWFTIGTLNFFDASNLLLELDFEQSTAVVTCAYPGDTLQQMVHFWKDPFFSRLLSEPRFAMDWDAILISAGGNDMIDAAQVPTVDENGSAISPDRRLLLTPNEAAQKPAPTEAEQFVSQAGWERFAHYLNANFDLLVKERDHGRNRDRPIFLHTYVLPTVRPAGTLRRPMGWLFPAFESFGIPVATRQGVSDVLFNRLRQLLRDLSHDSGAPTSLPHIHVFDSAAVTTIKAAESNATGPSNDWTNEIHLSREGYRKIGRPFGAFIEQVLSA
jgi:hypothetical protein